MNALLIIAHGSKSESANDEIAALATRLHNDKFQLVAHAFLEAATPSISDAVDALIADGATEIIALPYFLAAGRHVAEDVPNEITKLAAQYPQVKFILALHIGAAKKIAATIDAHIYDYIRDQKT